MAEIVDKIDAGLLGHIFEPVVRARRHHARRSAPNLTWRGRDIGRNGARSRRGNRGGCAGEAGNFEQGGC